MGKYATEQGGDSDDGPRLDADLKPWAREEWGLDVFLDEFPYFQYAGQDFPPEDDDKARDWMGKDWTDDDPATWPDYVKQRGPFRTDIVGVSVDRQALSTRIRRLGATESMNGSTQAKRRRRRTYLSFVGDGPMTRDYWEQDHGGTDELRGYGEGTARKAFGWLKKRGFLREVGNTAWDAVDLPLHVHGRTHAFELKLSPGEWDTALEQAARASVFADYRWVVYDRDTAPTDPAQLETFRERGVGLITVHPEDGVEIEVWADQCTPEVTREVLNRYNVERWDVNERVLKQLNRAYEWEPPDPDPDAMFTPVEPSAPNILSDLDPANLEIDPNPPTVHGGRVAEGSTPDPTEDVKQVHKPLTAFGGESDE